MLASIRSDPLSGVQMREVKAPRRIQIEKRGDYVFMSIAREGEALQSAGGSFRIRERRIPWAFIRLCRCWRLTPRARAARETLESH